MPDAQAFAAAAAGRIGTAALSRFLGSRRHPPSALSYGALPLPLAARRLCTKGRPWFDGEGGRLPDGLHKFEDYYRQLFAGMRVHELDIRLVATDALPIAG